MLFSPNSQQWYRINNFPHKQGTSVALKWIKSNQSDRGVMNQEANAPNDDNFKPACCAVCHFVSLPLANSSSYITSQAKTSYLSHILMLGVVLQHEVLGEDWGEREGPQRGFSPQHPRGFRAGHRRLTTRPHIREQPFWTEKGLKRMIWGKCSFKAGL